MATNFSSPLGTTAFTVLTDDYGNAIFAYGPTVPASVAGYAVGCIWITTSGSLAVKMNVGTASSCNFSTTLSGT
jgi:hypothetical protein